MRRSIQGLEEVAVDGEQMRRSQDVHQKKTDWQAFNFAGTKKLYFILPNIHITWLKLLSFQP